MTIRYYICPVIAGVSKVGSHILTGGSAFSFSMQPNVVGTRALVYVNGTDLTLLDADSQCVDVFEKLSDAQGSTHAQIISWLRNTLFSSLSGAVQTRVLNRLTSAGYAINSITVSSKAYDVLDIIHQNHAPGTLLENLWIAHNGIG